MIEKLIENWLTNVHELGYQIPFCEVLLTERYSLLHVSRHGRGEHGKDLIARDSQGRLIAFQLKGGDINLTAWHAMRGEVEELVRLPVSVTAPQLRTNEAHTPILVTNGELTGDAPRSIEAFATEWERLGSPRLEIWQKHQLLGKFIAAHGGYLPAELEDFREFVELYVADFQDRISREKFVQFLAKLVNPQIAKGRGRRTKRAIESMVLVASYVIELYERAGNHVSALEGWTIVGASMFHVAEREGLPGKYYEASLNLVWHGLVQNLDRLQREVLDRDHFVEPDSIFAETDFIRGVRTATTLGWLATRSLIRGLQGEYDPDNKRLVKIFRNVRASLRITGEADWPYIVSISLFIEKWLSSNAAEALIASWVRSIIDANKNEDLGGIPPPYWLQEKVLALRYGQLAPHEEERFTGNSYTIQSALDMMVRRLRRQFIATYWSEASRLTFCNYVPDSSDEWFLWRGSKGDLQLIVPEQPVSWREWTKRVSTVNRDSVPGILLKHPQWILPYALTYPQRLNLALLAVVEAVFSRTVDLT
jgi:hypothetical protein